MTTKRFETNPPLRGTHLLWVLEFPGTPLETARELPLLEVLAEVLLEAAWALIKAA